METFFRYLNLLPLPLWLAMILAPGHPLTERLSRSGPVFGLVAFNYLIAMIIALRQGFIKNATRPKLASLAGLQILLSTPGGALASWGHMLALDLFVGAWIYRQARRFQTPSWLRIGALFFTLVTGPFGLLIFLLWWLFQRRGPLGNETD